MSNKILIFVLLFLTGCANWNHIDVPYFRCEKLDELHVHLYNHETCEWRCLYMEEDKRICVDTFNVKYKTNKKGVITKVKLIK